MQRPILERTTTSRARQLSSDEQQLSSSINRSASDRAPRLAGLSPRGLEPGRWSESVLFQLIALDSRRVRLALPWPAVACAEDRIAKAPRRLRADGRCPRAGFMTVATGPGSRPRQLEGFDDRDRTERAVDPSLQLFALVDRRKGRGLCRLVGACAAWPGRKTFREHAVTAGELARS